jgi:hypothetical protein
MPADDRVKTRGGRRAIAPGRPHLTVRARPELGLAACLILGCGAPGASDAPAFSTADSAGVTLVHNRQTGDGVRLELVEDLRIGDVASGNHLQFFQVRDIAVDDRGRLYVGDGGSSEVRVFERDGTYIRSLGRSGSGPAGFRFISGVLLRGDTIVVLDDALHRATFFDTAGALLGEAPTRFGVVNVTPVAPASGGWIITYRHDTAWPYRVGVPYRDTTRFALMSALANASGPDTARVTRLPQFESLVRVPGPRTFGIQGGGIAITASSPLWEPRAQYDADGIGRLHIAHGALYRIDTWEFSHDSARLARRVTRDHAPVPVTTSLVERYFAEVELFFDTTSRRGDEFELSSGSLAGRRSLPTVDALPATGRLNAGRDGSIWVERPDLVDDPLSLEWTLTGPGATYWDIFDSEGRFVGTVQLPARCRIYNVTRHEAIGVVQVDAAAENVVRWSVSPVQG